ncbi:MAG: hypothetical protein QM541_04560 [Flavobacterium sp.]|nr:hypothetical protein [Flavobacterium sp.]
MRKSLSVLPIFCLLYSSCVVSTYVEKSSLYETSVSKSDTKIKSILLVGVGSTPSRLFLENLSTEIIKNFKRLDITCDFTYEGKIPKGSHVDLKEIVTADYNAYLVINPIDTSYIDAHKDVGFFVTPLPSGYGASGSVIGNQYKEDFYVELYTNNGLLNKVWQAELKLDFDVVNNDKYVKIAKEIFDRLIKNGFIINK